MFIPTQPSKDTKTCWQHCVLGVNLEILGISSNTTRSFRTLSTVRVRTMTSFLVNFLRIFEFEFLTCFVFLVRKS